MLLLLLIGFAGLTIGIVLAYARSRCRTLPPDTRTTLATVICLWEFIAAALILVSQVAQVYFKTLALPPGITVHPVYSPRDAILTFNCLLSVAAAIALWRMMRLALPLFAIKFALSFTSAIYFFLHHPVPASQSPEMRIAVYLCQFLALALSAAMLWYVHRITSPQPTPTQTLPPPIPSL